MEKATNLLPKLMTCAEEQGLANSAPLEREELLKLGINTSSSLQSAILYRAFNDILVAVNKKSGDITLCTASPNKISELVANNCLIPRDSSFSFESDLLNRLQYNTINSYIAKGKYYLVQLIPVSKTSSLFMCKLSGFNPYPDFKNSIVYSLSAVYEWCNKINMLLTNKVRVEYGSESSICSLHTTGTHLGNKASFVKPMRCTAFVFNAVDISGTFIQIPMFSLKGIYSVDEDSECAFVKDVSNAVVRIGSVDYTANRGILEKFYGDTLYMLESDNVRKRWALEEALSFPSVTLEYLMSKYKLYRCVPAFGSVGDLVEYLGNTIEWGNDTSSSSIVIRALVNESLIACKKVSYCRTVNLSKVPKYKALAAEEVLPEQICVSGVSTNYGYQTFLLAANKVCSLRGDGEREFRRRFGNFYGELDIFRLRDKHPVVISLNAQKSLVYCLRLGDGVSNFNEYYRVIKGILESNDVSWVSEQSVRYLFMNRLALKLKENGMKICDIKDYSTVSWVLWKYLEFCVSCSEEEHKSELIDSIIRYNVNTRKIMGSISKYLQGEKQSGIKITSALLLDVLKGKIRVTMPEIDYSIEVSWKQSDKGVIQLGKHYIKPKVEED